jgi:hypothetical protein
MRAGTSTAYAGPSEAGDRDWFEPVPLPAGPWPGRAAEAERRLLVAVLADAIACYQAPGRRGRDARRAWVEARDWLTSHDRVHVFSFENLCDALGIDADAIRNRLATRDFATRDHVSGRVGPRACGGASPRGRRAAAGRAGAADVPDP